MPMTEELTAQIDTAIDNVIEESKEEVAEEKNTEILDEVKGKSDGESKEITEEVDAGSDPADDTQLDSDSDREQGEEKEVKEKVKEEVVVKVAPVVISDATLTNAVRAGFTITEARSYQSDESLARAVAIIESIKEKVTPKEEEEADPFVDMLKLDPEKYEPEVIEMYDSLLGVMRKQHEELKELRSQSATQTEQSNSFNQEAYTREITEWFDGQVAKLGDDYSEVLGKGGMNSLAPGTPQYVKREAIAGQVAVMMAGYNASGMQPPSRDEMFDMASRMVLRDEYQKIHDEKLSKKLEKRSGQHISRVNSRGAKATGDPFDDTVKMLNEKYSLNK